MLKNKKIMVLLGSVLIVIVLAIFLWPHFKQGYAGTTVDVVRLAQNVKEGMIITEDMLQVKEFPTAYLGEDKILTKEAVVGQYAAADLFQGDIVTTSKIVGSEQRVFYEQNSLVAITLPTLSASVAAKIAPGDHVNVFGYPKDNANAGIVWKPELLQNMEVAYIVSSDAQDAEEGIAPASVVLKVTSPEQTQELIKLEYMAQIHLERISNNAGSNSEAVALSPVAPEAPVFPEEPVQTPPDAAADLDEPEAE